jgi:hypothetical protein
MRYVFLLHGDEAAETALPPEESRRIMEEHGAFVGRMRAEGRYVAGAGLEPSSSAILVRRADDDLVTDGPFVEAKEQVGGFYLMECADRDEAVRLARQIPVSPGLVVEVRPAPY